MGAVKDRTRKSKNDSRTFVKKQKSYDSVAKKFTTHGSEGDIQPFRLSISTGGNGHPYL